MTGQREEKTKQATDETYEEMVGQRKAIVIAGTEWCGDTARMIKEAVPVVMRSLEDDIVFVYVMLQQARDRKTINPELNKKLRVSRYPTIIALDVDGRQVLRKESEGPTEQQIVDLWEAVECLLK